MLRFIPASFVLLYLLGISAAPAQELNIGDPAPSLTVSEWVQGQPVEAFARGRVYVIEFWATWCAPCRATVPHLNEVIAAMAGRPVDFISLSDETRAQVRPVAERLGMQGHIALDAGGKTSAAYAVSVIPHTVIVGPDGRIAAVTYPEHVTAAALERILAGERADLPVKTGKSADLGWADTNGLVTRAGEATTMAVLQRSEALSGAIRARQGSGMIIADGVDPKTLIQFAYGVPFGEIAMNLQSLDKGPYRVFVFAGEGNDELARALLAGVLEATFGFKTESAQSEVEIPVMRRLPGGRFKLEPYTGKDNPGTFAREGQVNLTMPLQGLAKFLGSFAYGKDGIDETGIEGRYLFDVRWTPGDLGSLEKSLASIGLELTLEKRKRSILQIEPVSRM